MARKVFSFHLDPDNSASVQYRDPFDLHRRWFEATGGDPASMLLATKEPEPVRVVGPGGNEIEQPAEETNESYRARLDAYDKLIHAVRVAFELPNFDKATGAGVLDEDVLRILNEWDEWEEGLKKSTAPAPTPPPPSAFTHSEPATSAIPRRSSPSGS